MTVLRYFSLIQHKNIYYGYTLEAPLRGTSNENPQQMFCGEISKLSQNYHQILQ